ncbi:MAG: excinuclease ABC subunit UvrB, partial [Candidatus Margulisbacteria bacterium]|nr:excinuclease ABC subunit UvrB [Candidatus Margulisiibacteriota bacterium]
MVFELVSDYSPAGDQPDAIHQLVMGLNAHKRHQVLLGVTGSGKTFTIANVIQQVQRPALVIAHNKTLAAQLCSEFRTYFPNNQVEYFVSYYDYYQPEAYIPSRDIYIEKEAEVNEEIERLRHSATRSLLMSKDVIVVASVSCIYGLGTPQDYMQGVLMLKQGETLSRRTLLQKLERVRYERNDIELKRGRYRVRGDTVDIFPSWDDLLIRIVFFGDEIEQICEVEPVSGHIVSEKREIDIYPATHYVVQDHLERACKDIEQELMVRLKILKKEGKIVEAQRLETRTHYDLEMMREMGYCKGIENYSRHLSKRIEGSPPGVLLDFFSNDFITIIDESHVTVPQIRGMYEGDKSRKSALVAHGFRLPSTLDNRPLTFLEFEDHVQDCIYVSATPGQYELGHTQIMGGNSPDIIEQIIRPTGLIDPQVKIRPSEGQIDDLLTEIHHHIGLGNRILITALTKQLSEDVSEFLQEKGIKVRYLHSDIVALDRLDILRELREGVFDVLVGVNLLREGLDLPEVSLV